MSTIYQIEPKMISKEVKLIYKQGTPVWQADKTHPVPLDIPRCISAIEDSLVVLKGTGNQVKNSVS